MGIATLVLGLVLWLGPHVLVTRRAAREAVVKRLGEGLYKGLFSLVALIGIVLIGYGFAHYRAAGWIDLWDPPAWTRHLDEALMWPAMICVTAAYIPGHIKRVLKHPMLVGVKLWAVGHLVSNGDLGSIILFGTILAWAVYDRISLKHRRDRGAPPIPTGGRRYDWMAVLVGTIIYLAVGLVFHPLVIGVPAFGTPVLGT